MTSVLFIGIFLAQILGAWLWVGQLQNSEKERMVEVSQAMASLHSDQALLIALSGEGWAMELLAEDPTGGNLINQTIMAKFGLKLCRYCQLRVVHSQAVLVTCRARLT